MKREIWRSLLTVLFCIMLTLSFFACGNNDGNTDNAASSDASLDSGQVADNSGADEEFIKMELSYATWLDNAASNGIYERLQAKIDEKMDGAITIVPYLSGSLLGQNDVWDGVISGVADMGHIQCSMLSDRLNLTLLLETAGLEYSSSQSASYVMRDYLTQLAPKELEDVIWFMPCNTAPNSIISKKPVLTVDDIKGMQIRSSGPTADAVTAWGGTPVSMTSGEIYEGLRNSLIDGAIILPNAIGNFHLQEVAGHLTVIPLGGSCQMEIMNKEKFNQMTPKQQEIFMECTNEVFEEYISFYQEAYDQPYLDFSAEAYDQIDSLDYLQGDALKGFADKSRHLSDNYAKTLNDKGYDGDGALKLARELCEKYNAQFGSSRETAFGPWLDKAYKG
jgi:TRAP-type C4-dicarboxylate transport system substrate-binding protein